MTTYNSLPYPTKLKPESDPAVLGAYARSFGVAAPDPSSSRALEIGCASGGNIISLAARHPGGQFTGIDLSDLQIQEGQQQIKKLGLKNITLDCGDVSQTHYAGPFDYIICHGVFSWVPEQVQEAILDLVTHTLSPNGVLFLSYNVLPGWRQKGVIRDVLQFGARSENHASLDQQVAAGLQFLTILAKTRRKDSSDVYGSYLNEAVIRLEKSDPSYIFHEYLESNNQAFLFSQLAEQLSKKGLSFFSETKLALASDEDLDEDAQNFIADFRL